MKTYELSLTQNYVSDWTLNMALRELIQNGTDQEILQPHNKFSISYEDGILRFRNETSSLKINTLLLGRSTKARNEDTVGQFGEGYKIAALVLNRLGKSFTIYNFSKQQIWKTRFVNSRRWLDRILVFDVDDYPTTETGLIIEVGNITEQEYEDFKKTWLGFRENLQKISTSYGDILLDEEEVDRIYVNGLYIFCSASLTYGYNFKPQYLKLERDRMSCDSFDAKMLTSRMLNEAFLENKIDPTKIHELIDESANDADLLHYVENTDQVAESYLQVFDKENLRSEDAFDPVHDRPIPVSSQAEYNNVTNLGGNPVFVSYGVGSLLLEAKKERISELKTAYINEETRTPKELLELWIQQYRNCLSDSAVKEFKEIIEKL